MGTLSRAGTLGELFTISYTPLEYGKVQSGTLIILTDEMQWSYDVRGSHPKYAAPQKRVSHRSQSLQGDHRPAPPLQACERQQKLPEAKLGPWRAGETVVWCMPCTVACRVVWHAVVFQNHD